jgi:hypothetical protein
MDEQRLVAYRTVVTARAGNACHWNWARKGIVVARADLFRGLQSVSGRAAL